MLMIMIILSLSIHCIFSSAISMPMIHDLHLQIFLIKTIMIQQRVCWGYGNFCDYIPIAIIHKAHKLTNCEGKTRWSRYQVTTGQDVKYLYISLLKSLMVTPLLSADWHMGKSPLASCQDDWLFGMQRGLLEKWSLSIQCSTLHHSFY